ncbi:PadR family transcriptional regulator [Parafrigoribacterium soli]|uniref:PadR family transcriptional regulator n=1 Tax=Parafrigoribacterium soli TaxID=3144663 RepID=UPI0032EE9579
MSVRDGALAILTLGPAYGLQLHAELAERAPHRKPVNVGQIYGTLERLAKQGLVVAAGTTDDGLPLYALTEGGDRESRTWMTEPATASLPEWTEMLDQVLITSSIDPASAMTLARSFRGWWDADLAATRLALQTAAAEPTDELRQDQRLALVAREALAVAALAWIGAATAAIAENDSARGYSRSRPRRGRRPGA